MHAVGQKLSNVPEVESQTETPSMRIAHMRMSENRQTRNESSKESRPPHCMAVVAA